MVGVTTILFELAPEFHVYVVAPLAVIVAEAPLQIKLFCVVKAMVGLGLVIMAMFAPAVHANEFEPNTEYKLGAVGLTTTTFELDVTGDHV
jgi:hypothetical protein